MWLAKDRREHGSRLVEAVALLAIAWAGGPVSAETTRYAMPWAGGTIAPGSAVVIEDGGSVTANVVVDGMLRFERTLPLTVTSMISGTGGLVVANTGTVALAGLTSGTGQFNLAINVSAGQLSIGSTGTNPLVMGSGGNAALEVTGGQVRSGNAFLGVGTGGVGAAAISGGSWFTNNRLLHVGHSGTGTLLVAGGQISNSSGVIGSTNTGVGSAVVSSGTWSNGGGLFVGGYQGSTGRGTLTLTGGQITNVAGNIGVSQGSIGSATVSGGVWTGSSALTVANLGIGSLDITGGFVSSASGAIGSGSSGVGEATIVGGTWSMAGGLVVGGAGVGTLAISGSGGTGGTVIVGGTLSRGAAGTISLGAGGMLQIGSGTTAARLASDLVNNGSVVFRPSGTSVLAHAVSGSGALTVVGPGRLAVTGTSSYSGPTEVAGGSLLVSGALGSTAVTVKSGGLLGGAGSVGGPVTVQTGGTLAPGASIESMAIGSLSLLDGSAFDVEIDSSASAAGSADLLRVSGDVAISGTVSLDLVDLAASPALFPADTILSLINYSGSWNGGLFSYGGTTLADGASFGIGSQLWTIDYDAVSGGVNFPADYLPGGRFVNLTAVPEPATLGLVLAGLSCAARLITRRLLLPPVRSARPTLAEVRLADLSFLSTMNTTLTIGLFTALLLAPLAALHAAEQPERVAATHAACRVGIYYFGMWAPSAFHVVKGFPFKRPDFYSRAETPVQPVYADDGKRITGYVPQGHVPQEDWWVGVRDLWDKERCWPADPADASDAYLTLRKGDFSHLQPVIGYYDLTKPETIRQHIAQARAFGIEFFNFYWYWNSFTSDEELNTGLEQFLGVDGNPMKFAISICQHGGPFVLWGDEESVARRGNVSSCFDIAIEKLVGYVKRENYLRTSDGRPIIYLLSCEGIVNEKTDATGQVVGTYEPQGNTIEKFIDMLRSEVRKAIGHAPLVVLAADDREYPYQKPDGSLGTVSAPVFADAVTRLAPKRGNDALREDQQKFRVPVMPGFTQNFDERPRYGCIKNPPCMYDPTDSFRKNFQRDLTLLKAWMDEQPREESRILSIYAWNEWHEGGIIEPNVRDGAHYLDVINTVFQLPRNPCDPSLLDQRRPAEDLRALHHSGFSLPK